MTVEACRPPTALFVSPHLDDVAFSCGGTLAMLAKEGWHTVLATVFTESVPEPTGFALACQTDKGIAPGIDYMALRREEDREFASRAGVGRIEWLGLPEAPHRGYHNAAALFSGVGEGDEVWREVAARLAGLLKACSPEVVFAPQALGSHVDHLQVVRAIRALPKLAPRVIWYRDAPYAVRNPSTETSPLLPKDLEEVGQDITKTLETKLSACTAYSSQLGFQFGGEDAMRRVLADFAAAEARRLSYPAEAIEAPLFSSRGASSGPELVGLEAFQK